MKIFLIFIISVIIISCNQHSRELRYALSQSGSNRYELEKVLEHYEHQGDPLKMKAAQFLISNMPGHYSNAGDYLTRFNQEIKANYPDLPYYMWGAMSSVPPRYPETKPFVGYEQDINLVTADYLIAHIDRQFRLWHEVAWGKDITFDVFCEYILPYRVDTEPLYLNVPDSIDRYATEVIELSKSLESIRPTINKLTDYIANKLIPMKNTVRFALPLPIGSYERDCVFTALATQSRLKLLGIPSAIDFTPAWPDYNGSHYWNSILDPEVVLSLKNENLAYRAAKVYRKTYSHQPCPKDNGLDYIPTLFQSPFIKDVTDLYVTNADISVDIKTQKGDKPGNVYLSVFCDRKWDPIAWASTTSGKKVDFHSLGVDVLYQPLYYRGKQEVIAGYPFVLTMDKKIRPLIPKKDSLIRLHLTRKFPLNPNKFIWSEGLVGAVIEGANTPDFSDADTIHIIAKPDYGPYYRLISDNHNSYRYWRFRPKQNVTYLAEFCLEDSTGNKIAGDPISDFKNASSEIYLGSTSKTGDHVFFHPRRSDSVWQIFDDNFLSYAVLLGWIGIDCRIPVKVSSFVCSPRNDENYITPGDVYELFYANQHGWISLGRKKATLSCLEYENVPSNAVYWLFNHSRGKEERPFTVENGNITFR